MKNKEIKVTVSFGTRDISDRALSLIATTMAKIDKEKNCKNLNSNHDEFIRITRVCLKTQIVCAI